MSNDFTDAVRQATADVDATLAEDNWGDATPLESTTDTGNANRFIRLFGDRVRYCDVEGRWYIHDGCRWAPDDKLLVAEWMRRSLQSIFSDAALAADEAEAKALGKWGTRSLSSASRKAALECAKSDPRIAVHPAEFDQGPYLLNCPNGTLDLKTRELRPHDPADLLRKTTAAPYIAGERSELWERVIAEATGDTEFAAVLQRACGYSATGDTSEEVFFIMHGPTLAVKSTICNAIDATLDDYSASVNPETWLERGQVGGTRGDLVELDGVRMAISAEASARNAMATALLKAFTGGDRITVRRIFERDRSMKPTAKVWLHTNQVPKMPDDDDAIWRRAVIFPFEHPPADPDPRIKATLCDVEQSGTAVLAWIVEGCYQWQERGLAVPDLVKHATQVVRLGMDPLRDFFDECCIFELDVWTSTGELRAAYDHWRKSYGTARGIGAKEWGVRLGARGLEPSKRHGVRGWLGVRLADAEYVESPLPVDGRGR
jgi:putative DNA primase/helicase